MFCADAARGVVIAAVMIAGAAGALSAQETVPQALVSDIDVRIRDNGSSVIFYDGAGNPCMTAGTITVYKTIIRFRDQVKMEGRGVNQQFVRERVPYEEFGIAAQQNFTADDFKEIKTTRGKKLVALDMNVPGIRRGETVRVVFGSLEKTVTAGY